MKLYKDGIAALKRYELHPKLSKENKKQYLIDIYYSESSMNNFKTSLIAQLEKISTKMEQVEKEFKFNYPHLISSCAQARSVEKETKDCDDLKAKFITEVKEQKEALIFSIITAIYEDLKALQVYMLKMQASTVIPVDYLRSLSQKNETHARLIQEALLHVKTVEEFCGEIAKVKEKNAREIFKTKQQQNLSHFLKKMITLKELKVIRDSIEKQDKDIQYLKKPSQVPQAYECAIAEIVRRRKFKQIFDADIAKIKNFV